MFSPAPMPDSSVRKYVFRIPLLRLLIQVKMPLDRSHPGNGILETFVLLREMQILPPLKIPSHHYTASGSYTATLIATGNSGCKDTVTQTFFVNGGVPVAGFTVQNAGSLCSNRAVTIVDGSSVDVGNLVKVEIYWDYDNDPTNKTIDDVPAAGKTYNHSYPEFGSPASINYTVRYVAYSGINCVNTITKSVTVLATPILEFNAVPAVCSDAPSFQVTQARIINALSGKGIFSGPGIVSPDGMFSPAEAGFGPHTLRYSYNADNTCSNFVEAGDGSISHAGSQCRS